MTTQKQSNSLVFKTSKTVGKKTIYVNIQLNDECKNGHQDFAITGDIYETGKPKIDRYHISGGCIHDDIQKYFPEFKQFIKLHLCDYAGVPMHPVANGYYFLTEGFNKTKPSDSGFKNEFCDYYRVTPKQFDTLKEAHSKIHFGMLLNDLGILSQWEKEAKEAIKELERLTETIFVNDSKRSQYIAPTPEEIQAETEKIQSGYYTDEAKKGREAEKLAKEIKEMEQEADASIENIRIELAIKMQLHKLGGKRFSYGCIWYNHNQKLKPNWGTEKLTVKEIRLICENIVLPMGATFDLSAVAAQSVSELKDLLK